VRSDLRYKMTITTASLTLKVQTSEEVLATINGMSEGDRSQVSREWLARVEASLTGDAWTHGFVISRLEDSERVGQCGFVGPPDKDGVVEIAYGIEPDFQGRGYATEAAMALVSFASADPRVVTIRAHTLPQANASSRVLTKCGFNRIGESVDHEAGLVWRWERQKSR